MIDYYSIISFILDRVYILPCEWNYRMKFCSERVEERCLVAEETGARLVHGSGNSFEKEVETIWQVIHKAFKQVSSSLVYISMNTRKVLTCSLTNNVGLTVYNYQWRLSKWKTLISLFCIKFVAHSCLKVKKRVKIKN